MKCCEEGFLMRKEGVKLALSFEHPLPKILLLDVFHGLRPISIIYEKRIAEVRINLRRSDRRKDQKVKKALKLQ